MTENTIRLSLPRLERSEFGVRLCCDVTDGGKTETAWFEVTEEYAPYLTDDRLDAFVTAWLPRAMRERADLVCEGPVSRRLLYQINHYLTPVLARNVGMYHAVSVIAKPAADGLPCEGAVATGWTGGVDSMFTLRNALDPEEPGKRLTHLLIANNGALESDHNEALLRHLVKRAENGIARETGLKVAGVSSNLDALLPEPYLAVAGFRLPAAVLVLQKLVSVFYHSSAYEYEKFSFVGENSAYYEMFLLPNLSTENTVFYSAGGATPRIEKLRILSGYPPALKYLHPCIYTAGENCCRCGKCIRTETALYALGTLDRFGGVFDLDAFEKNRDWYVANVIAKKNSQHYGEAWALLKRKGLITKRAEELARILCAAQKIAGENREELSRKMEERHV